MIARVEARLRAVSTPQQFIKFIDLSVGNVRMLNGALSPSSNVAKSLLFANCNLDGKMWIPALLYRAALIAQVSGLFSTKSAR